MRIAVIGATGTIGGAVAKALAARHEVVPVSRTSNPSIDIAVPASIRAFYDAVGPLDGVVCCTGAGAMKPLGDLSDDDVETTVRSKLLGQVNLVRHGLDRLNDGGVFVLTAGAFSQHPMPGVSAVAMANGGVESFTRSAALDLPRGLRVNAVSPPFIRETAEAMGLPGGLPAADNAKAYLALVDGTENGAVVFPG